VQSEWYMFLGSGHLAPLFHKLFANLKEEFYKCELLLYTLYYITVYCNIEYYNITLINSAS